MPSLRKRGNKWHIRFRDSRRTPPEVVVSLDARAWTKRQAAAYMWRLQGMYERGEYDPWTQDLPTGAERYTGLLDALEDYLHTQGRTWSESHRREATRVLRTWAAALGNIPLVDLSRYPIGVTRPGLSVESQRTYTRRLRAFIRYLNERYGLNLPLPEMPRAPRRLPVWITEEELERICQMWERIQAETLARPHVPRHRDRRWMCDVWCFAFYTGMRLGEIMRLRVGDIDLHRGTIRVVSTKTAREDLIPLVPQVCGILERYTQGREPGAPLWGRTSGDRVSKAFKQAVRAALGREDVHFHTLRHSCAVFWRTRGVYLEDIRDLLRHARITTTEIYEAIAIEDLQRRFLEAARENLGNKREQV